MKKPYFPRQAQLLEAIRAEPGIRNARLARMAGISSVTSNSVCKGLERKGLVRRERSAVGLIHFWPRCAGLEV